MPVSHLTGRLFMMYQLLVLYIAQRGEFFKLAYTVSIWTRSVSIQTLHNYTYANYLSQCSAPDLHPDQQ